MAGRIITLAQQKGGSGKTTIAAHLAVAFVRQGGSVALLDVDPQAASASGSRRGSVASARTRPA